MGRESFDRKVEQLQALRSAPTGTAEPQLRRALKDRSNYVVSKAAAVAAEIQLRALVPDLLAAFDRFLLEPKSDPQCWAKNAIARALKDLGHTDPEPFLKGMAHAQLEPVWGGVEDTAATLRGTCALALVACRIEGFELLVRLTDLLADPQTPVRVDAVRAIAQASLREGILPLRLKALAGDSEPEVVGYCFSALLNLDARGQLPFIGGFLRAASPEVRLEAAAALADSHEPEAMELLRQFWSTQANPENRRALVRILGASPVPAAGELLLTILAESTGQTAEEALAALRGSRHHAQFAARIAAILAHKRDSASG